VHSNWVSPSSCNSMPNMYIFVKPITAKSCLSTTCNINIYIHIYRPKNTGLIIGYKSTTNMCFVSLILGVEPRELLAYQQIYSSNSKLNLQC
jgi:hypothetical protein